MKNYMFLQKVKLMKNYIFLQGVKTHEKLYFPTRS